MKNADKNYLYAGLVSLALSLCLLVWVYSYWNRSYTYGYGDSWISKLAKHTDLHEGHDFDPGNIVPVNVAYDTVLVPLEQYVGYCKCAGLPLDRPKEN